MSPKVRRLNLEQAREAVAQGQDQDVRVHLAVWVKADEAIALQDMADLRHISLAQYLRQCLGLAKYRGNDA